MAHTQATIDAGARPALGGVGRVRAGKAVFEAEYNVPLSQFCGQSVALGFSAIRKDTDLDATRQACPAAGSG